MSNTKNRLGFFGILKVTTQILQSNFKHFLCIVLILQALPYVFLVAFNQLSNHLVAIAVSISMIYHAATDQLPPPQDDNNIAMQTSPIPILNRIIIFICFFFIGFVSVPPLTFSFCRGYLNKSLNFKGSLMAIPRSIINLILTSVSLTTTFLGIIFAAIILLILFGRALSAVKVNLAIPVIILFLGLIVGLVYFAIIWSLVKPVTILEEKWGWEAMKRSNYLLDGSKWLVFWLSVFFSICSLFVPISISKDAAVLWKLSVAAVNVTLMAVMSLYSIGALVVLYLSCKSFHNESVETLIAASAQFGENPANLSKYMDLESANLNVHIESVETLIAASAQFGENPANLSKHMDLESANLNVHM